MIKQKKDLKQAVFVQEMMTITQAMWRNGWDEANGGNVSLIIPEDDILEFLDPNQVKRQIDLDFPVKPLANLYFIVTGSGKYFKNIAKDPEDTLAIIKVSENGQSIDLLWGLSNGGKPTSELASHFMSHITRLEQDPKHRVIMHTHTTNVIAMTFVHELTAKAFTKTLWQMCTECVVVFPEGVALLPWMVPGTSQIGEATAKAMGDHRLVVWPHHGIFGAGSSIDDAFGLIETAEKAAQVYMLVSAHQGGVQQSITDQELMDLAAAFNVTPNPNYM
ncbi:L-rhamnulose 1-phosphate aldolase [Amphibacillus marinus]|uniref:Rhamnulose-1-phosphate aldolase n=1 Tax=Amphibacillus marinus TaxID=872970 RepID=A0A1H8H503_9BACI|nr:rhamnulose-1-phosphate aldolase [Amphibacillus marinus]SEN50568.1 L-rhamnulose 1-phosphate aldolase [Amphibacillus marinus]